MMRIKPSDILFSQSSIYTRFRLDTGRHVYLEETFEDLLYKRDGLTADKIEPIQVVRKDGKWWTLTGNKRLYIYKELEDLKILSDIPVVVESLRSLDIQAIFRKRYTTKCSGRDIEVEEHEDEYGDFRSPHALTLIDRIIEKWSSEQDQRGEDCLPPGNEIEPDKYLEDTVKTDLSYGHDGIVKNVSIAEAPSEPTDSLSDSDQKSTSTDLAFEDTTTVTQIQMGSCKEPHYLENNKSTSSATKNGLKDASSNIIVETPQDLTIVLNTTPGLCLSESQPNKLLPTESHSSDFNDENINNQMNKNTSSLTVIKGNVKDQSALNIHQQKTGVDDSESCISDSCRKKVEEECSEKYNHDKTGEVQQDFNVQTTTDQKQQARFDGDILAVEHSATVADSPSDHKSTLIVSVRKRSNNESEEERCASTEPPNWSLRNYNTRYNFRPKQPKLRR